MGLLEAGPKKKGDPCDCAGPAGSGEEKKKNSVKKKGCGGTLRVKVCNGSKKKGGSNQFPERAGQKHSHPGLKI